MDHSKLLLEWNVTASPFRSRVLWQQMGIAFGIPIVLLGLFMAAISERDRWQVALFSMAVTGGIIFGLLLPVILIFTFVGYQQHFVLDQEGARSNVTARSKTFLNVVQAGLLLSGRPSAMGAGLLMRTGDAIRWRDVNRVKVDEQQHHITFYRRDGPPFLMPCTTENFATVCEIVRAHCGIS